ncbi:MBL fold metallo-hydrolase [Streptomyces virginiae]|uniref:MBL fold metallo-hydrolase n=1 Tax=Streptomyces virginiae TaxID=1961 RepID=UPI0037A1D098
MTTTLSVRRLAWAGVEIRLGDTRLLIDPLENVAPLAPVMGPPHRPVDPVDTPTGTHALITHLHPDHYDHDLIARIAATGTIGCHTPSAAALHEAGITPRCPEPGPVTPHRRADRHPGDLAGLARQRL